MPWSRNDPDQAQGLTARLETARRAREDAQTAKLQARGLLDDLVEVSKVLNGGSTIPGGGR